MTSTNVANTQETYFSLLFIPVIRVYDESNWTIFPHTVRIIHKLRRPRFETFSPLIQIT